MSVAQSSPVAFTQGQQIVVSPLPGPERLCRRDGILEYYWGEHIHLGYYTAEERRRGYKKKDFKQAKFDFIDEMLRWSQTDSPKRILDVGCGIGGTSRYLARKFPDAQIEGQSLLTSPL